MAYAAILQSILNVKQMRTDSYSLRWLVMVLPEYMMKNVIGLLISK